MMLRESTNPGARGVSRWRARFAAFAVGTSVTAVLAACAPHVTSPVGVWEATGGDSGTVVLYADGRFRAFDVSYNLLADYRSGGDLFLATGQWWIDDGPEIRLRFSRAEYGGRRVDPVTMAVPFPIGSLRFGDVEGITSIEFKKLDPDE